MPQKSKASHLPTEHVTAQLAPTAHPHPQFPTANYPPTNSRVDPRSAAQLPHTQPLQDVHPALFRKVGVVSKLDLLFKHLLCHHHPHHVLCSNSRRTAAVAANNRS